MIKLFWWLVIPLYFISRLVSLTLIPIFTDEAIYLRWSQIISGDLKFLYLPLTDGKPPLFMWLAALPMKLPLDPLLAGRLVSVAAGFFAMLGVYFAARQLFADKKVAYLSTVFYLLSPFTFFYDRFALADSLLAMWGIWSLGLGIVLVRTLKLKTAVLLGLVMGLGWLTKTPAQFFLLLLPALALLKPKSYLRFGILTLIAMVIARAFYSMIFLLPQAYVINLKSYEFIVPPTELLKDPLRFFAGNFRAMAWWELSYLTWPVIVLISFSLIKINRQKFILFLYFSSLFLFMCLFNKVIYPRFLLTFTPMLLILAAAGLAEFKKLTVPALVLVAILPVFVDIKLLTDPARALIADNDANQYLNSWSAGYGIKELNSFFAGKKATVGVEGTFGLMPYGLELYQKDHPDLTIKPYWPLPSQLPPGLDYFIVYQRESAPADWPIELVTSYRQGSGNDSLKLYKIRL